MTCLTCRVAFVPAKPHYQHCPPCFRAQVADPSQHREREFRTIKLIVSEPVFRHWERALNRAAYESCRAFPTPDDIVECVATAMTNEPLHTPNNGFSHGEWIDAVEGGLVECRECHSKDRTQLDWHHVIARSQGEAGRAGPQVPLCRRCHMRIQPRWREWAIEQGFEIC